jgi:hypothetical protein
MSVEKQVEALENEIDSFFSHLALRHYPRNLAQWAVLTKVAIEVQRASEPEYGGPKHRHATINLSRIAGLLLDEIGSKGNQRFANRGSLRWSSELDLVAHRALKEGEGYFHAWASLSFWHQRRFEAEVCGRSVRFTSAESKRERQVKAFQKRMVKKADRTPASNSLAPMTPSRLELFERLVPSVGGERSQTVTYTVPDELYSDLFTWFKEQSELLVRHRDEIDLGRYSIRDVKGFLGALQTVCAVHDHVCFLIANKRREFPTNSAVLAKTKEDWVSELSRVSGIGAQSIAEIVSDLTFGARRAIDLHTELFVPLDMKGEKLGLLPHFGLSAAVDENLLRTLSRSDAKRYDALGGFKEVEMIDDLRNSVPKSFSVTGPYDLPREAQTDLDLVVVDESSSTLLVCELKWIRKPLFAKERIRADEEFLKGLDQLARLKTFLYANPSYLMTRGAVSRDLTSYRNVHFALVGRDHMVWPSEDPWCLIADYEVLKGRLKRFTDLSEMLIELACYDWLPVEGVDFEIRMDSATVNGVTIQGETYHLL